MCVFSVPFIVFLYIFVCKCLLQNNNHKTVAKQNNNTTSKQHPCVRGPLRECRSIRSGDSGLPYYCAPLVCISVVIGLLAVWRNNKPKAKKKISSSAWGLTFLGDRNDSPISG